MYLGQRLRELREFSDLKQKDIAKFLDISENLYCMYETEYQTIPSKYLISLANYFNISLDYLFGLSKEKNIINKDISIKLFGERLKKLRKDNKLTQIKLANSLNTTQSVIADYERGRYLIATPFLYTICKKYNISADYLLGRIDN